MSELTKEAIITSLRKLLDEKPLNKITIKNITDDCNVNRMTFYYHFRDIYSAIEWICREDAERIIAEHKSECDWKILYKAFFREILKKKNHIMNIYRCISRDEVESFLHLLVDGMILDIIDSYEESKYLSKDDKELIARIYSYPFTGLMVDWIKDDMKTDPEILVDKFALIINDSIDNTLDRFLHI